MNNKLVPAVIAGAAVGAAISMLDKKTRTSVKGKISSNNTNGVTSSTPSTKTKISNIKDEVMYWKDVIEEIRRKNPELEKAIMDAKDTFIEKKNQKKLSGPNQ
ncbi:YtxH domain-containing protein [Macrococcus sp. DPC7161]|uniref:YtxH domain-containing protein n=1 Tax=Macrococcus sp. DPC7161 TaxID=2507060 RepID=UPI00100AC3DD|nr:YtxH domain-containing protein [Macrococcus sp. DPC7161]RXK17753.1 YtxH domain-containing protein [Macrococcus sp. DPC7161]